MKSETGLCLLAVGTGSGQMNVLDGVMYCEEGRMHLSLHLNQLREQVLCLLGCLHFRQGGQQERKEAGRWLA